MTDQEKEMQRQWLLNQLKDIDNCEFAAFFTKLYENEMKNRNPEDYVTNPLQMYRMIEAYRFFATRAEKNNWKLEPFKINPIQESGDIALDFNLMWLDGDDVQEFAKILSYASGVTIDATLDGVVHLSLIIPNVYTKK